MNQYTNTVANSANNMVSTFVGKRGSNVAETANDKMMYGLTNVKKYVETRSITFWIVVGTVLVLLLVLLFYEWWKVYRLFNRYIDCGACYIRFRNVISDPSSRRPILHNYLVKPNNGYTYSMWLYVADWYNATGLDKWKNIYYRGPPIGDCKGADSLTWDSFATQQPGVWFSDVVNNIRVAVTTQTSMPSDCVAGGEGGTQKTATYNNTCGSGASMETTELSILEYADITDFPIGKWFQLLFVIDEKRMELYLNGKLVNTVVFVGQFTSQCDTENGHFGVSGTGKYSGRIMNFRYMPFVVPYQMIQMLYEYESKNSLLKIPNPMKNEDDSYRNPYI